MLQLKSFKGLPYYLQCLTLKDNKRQVDFVSTEQINKGHELLIGNNKYQITEIKEFRISGLDYGVNVPVYYHSTICDVIYLEAVK